MFWKDYGKHVRRLWLNQFGAIAFGIMLSFLSTSLSDRVGESASTVYFISGLLGMFFYCYLIYLVIWEVGAYDKIRVDAGRASASQHFGLKIALFYSIPCLAVTGIYLIATVVYKIAGVENSFVTGVVGVSGMASMVIEAPYIGFALAIFKQIGKAVQDENLLYYSILWFVSCAPAIITVWLGYLAGYKGKFMSKLYKKKKN